MSLNLTPVVNRNPKLCPIDPKNRTRFGEFVTMRKNDFYMSDSFWTKMGYPDYVSFAIDPEEKVFGIKKVDEKDPYSCKVKMEQTGGAKGYGMTYIVDAIIDILPFDIDIENENVTFLRGFIHDGYFCFDMKHADKRESKRRKKKQ